MGRQDWGPCESVVIEIVIGIFSILLSILKKRQKGMEP